MPSIPILPAARTLLLRAGAGVWTSGVVPDGATLVAGMALRWLRDEMLQLPAAGAYERMTGWAAKAPWAHGVSCSCPIWSASGRLMDPRARGAFLGLAAHHDHGDVVRAVMEVTFACRDAFAALQDAGANPERIVMAGGGSRSPFWRQMVADVFGLPVYAFGNHGSSRHGRRPAGGRWYP